HLIAGGKGDGLTPTQLARVGFAKRHRAPPVILLLLMIAAPLAGRKAPALPQGLSRAARFRLPAGVPLTPRRYSIRLGTPQQKGRIRNENCRKYLALSRTR